MIDLLSPYKDTIRLITTRAGERHGTVTARIHDKSQYEITTLRVDKITDGRHAEVEFVQDWKLDASRRDLTINAMFLDLKGALHDYFGGAADLEQSRVLFVGDAEARIQEDYLRMLRYFRVYARYGHKSQHDPQTLGAIRDNIQGLAQISGERIWTELKRILPLVTSNQVVPVLVNEVGALKYMGFTEPEASGSSTRDLSEFCAVHSRLFSDQEKGGHDFEPVTLLTSLVRDDDELLGVSSRLKFSNIERETALFIITNRANGGVLNERLLKRKLALASKPDQTNLKRFVVELLKYTGKQSMIEPFQAWEVPNFPLRGHIIGKRLKGQRRVIGKVMEELKVMWADSEFTLTESQLSQELDTILSKHQKEIEKKGTQKKKGSKSPTSSPTS
jgi:tRNA nucleotidyltransferase (CCA-adding enzyme)